MTISKYIVINSRGGAKITGREPRLNANEISLRIYLEVPNAMFERPRLEAIMKVPVEAIPRAKITTSLSDNVEKLIKQATGLTMKVNIIDQKEENKNK